MAGGGGGGRRKGGWGEGRGQTKELWESPVVFVYLSSVPTNEHALTHISNDLTQFSPTPPPSLSPHPPSHTCKKPLHVSHLTPPQALLLSSHSSFFLALPSPRSLNSRYTPSQKLNGSLAGTCKKTKEQATRRNTGGGNRPKTRVCTWLAFEREKKERERERERERRDQKESTGRVGGGRGRQVAMGVPRKKDESERFGGR